MNDINPDWEVSKKQNELWFRYFEDFLKEVRSDSIAPPAVGEIFNEEMERIFVLPDSFLKRVLPELKNKALFNTLFFGILSVILPTVILSFVFAALLSFLFSTLHLGETFVVILCLCLFLYSLRLYFRVNLLQQVYELNKQRYSINWTNPERLNNLFKRK